MAFTMFFVSHRRALIIVLVFVFLYLSTSFRNVKSPSLLGLSSTPSLNPQRHPIEHLILEALSDFQRILEHESHTLSDAAKAYRQRRGRHPPPQFDSWFKFEESQNATIIEELFDQIYEDLEPFWGMSQMGVRQAARRVDMRKIRIHDGVVTGEGDTDDGDLHRWVQALSNISVSLPDVTLPINGMTQARVLASWEDVCASMATASRSETSPSETKREFNRPKDTEDLLEIGNPDWIRN
ncbi:hypothetical protein P152DRAFT_459210 [Eremomyces bilateralis CBS 781.70]|uniref:Uncharacterized protein n=1 Tax=Eremomyces bilateralis CBS 781.70 TaxID=1392243 RepID=A0A6G1G130_9PEZI|nr:uncharacterized protein P152DRAFT_459210 [Eremomyces bilateralis CBS 781.70]KAF1811743.1 hypothetical protein P152DRAFT_459210 [Eremomyces bilateralis CBS 781.70]